MKPTPDQVAQADQHVAKVRHAESIIDSALAHLLGDHRDDTAFLEADVTAQLQRLVATDAWLRDALVAGYVHRVCDALRRNRQSSTQLQGPPT